MRHGLTASLAVWLGMAMCLTARAGEITVYRCTAADGGIALQDAPCPRDAQQEERSLRRPVDDPSPVAAAAASSAAPVASQEASVSPPVERAEPQALYECQRHDGSVYESDSGIPERRWVPLWVVGMDPRAPAQTFGRVGGTKPKPPRTSPGLTGSGIDPSLGPGAWVEDRCIRLSARAACDRRQQRLNEVGRQFRNSGQGERERLRGEQQGLREQLQRECG